MWEIVSEERSNQFAMLSTKIGITVKNVTRDDFLFAYYLYWLIYFFFSQKENITPVFSASGLWSVRCFWCGISDGVGLTPRIPFYPFHTFSNSTLYSHLRGLRLPPELSKSSVTALSSTLGGPIVVSAALNQTCWCVDGMSLVWRDERFSVERVEIWPKQMYAMAWFLAAGVLTGSNENESVEWAVVQISAYAINNS